MIGRRDLLELRLDRGTKALVNSHARLAVGTETGVAAELALLPFTECFVEKEVNNALDVLAQHPSGPLNSK
jgi:hypothetical protein